MKTNYELRLIIILLLSPFVIACIHALISRSVRLFNRSLANQAVVLLAIATAHIPVFMALWFIALRKMGYTTEIISGLLYSLVVYEALAYSYFHLFNMSETARRIKILLSIYRGGTLKISELSSSYSSEEMLANRLQRLIAMRQVRFVNDRYMLTSKLLYNAAKIISVWGRILGLPSPLSVYKKRRGRSGN